MKKGTNFPSTRVPVPVLRALLENKRSPGSNLVKMLVYL